MSLDLRGIIPPVSTPFASGKVAVQDLESLLNFHLDAGVHGLFMLGSTSETVALTDDQQQVVIETALRVAGGRVPVIAGAIDFTANRVIERARRAEALGVDGHVVLPPFYIKPTGEEIVRHYSAVREALGKPVIAYDLPGSVQTKLDRGSIRTLVKQGAIQGLKDSSGMDANFRGVIFDNRDHPEFRIFTGSELTVDAALHWGASGCVPGLGNVDPAGYVKMFELFQTGDFAAVHKEHDRLYRLFDLTGVGQQHDARLGRSASAWGGFKTALKLRGVIENDEPIPPMHPLNDAARNAIRVILDEVGLL